jgi:hypothetical protein
MRAEVVGGDVGRSPVDLSHRRFGEAAGEANHLVDRGLVGKRPQHARSDVACGSRDDDPHR